MFNLYFVTRTNRPERLFECIGTEFYRLVETTQDRLPYHQALRQIEELLGIALSIFQHLAGDLGESIDRLAYEVFMARRTRTGRSGTSQTGRSQVTRREAQQEQPPAEGWF